MTFQGKTVKDEGQAMFTCSTSRSRLKLSRLIKQHSWAGIVCSLELIGVGIVYLCFLWHYWPTSHTQECNVNANTLLKTTLIGAFILLPAVSLLIYHVFIISRTWKDDYETVFKMNKTTCLLLSVEGLPCSLFATYGILKEKKQPIRTYLIFRKIMMLLSFVLIVFFAAISLLQMIVGIPVYTVFTSIIEEEENLDILKYSVIGITACCAAFAVWNQYIILFYVLHLNMMDISQTTKLEI